MLRILYLEILAQEKLIFGGGKKYMITSSSGDVGLGQKDSSST